MVGIDGTAAFLTAMGSWVVVPIAWLAIGASIFGTTLQEQALPTHERVAERIKRVPNPVCRVAAQAAEPITTPIVSTLSALQKVAVAGLIPMALFCVVFVAADQCRVLVAWLMHLAAGPQERTMRAVIDPYIELAGRTTFTVLIVVLVAAAVHVVAQAQKDRDEKAAAEAATPGATYELAS